MSGATIPLIPRQVLLGNPDRVALQLSPDGTHISFIAPDEGVLNVWVAPAGEPEAARPVTHDRVRGIRMHYWAHTSEDILYLQDSGGDENWHLHRVNLATQEDVDLTPIDGVRAEIEDISHLHPDEVLVGLNDRDARYHDLYRLNVHTGERTLVFRNDAYAGTVADDDYRVRLALKFTPTAQVEVYRIDGDQATLDSVIEAEDSMSTQPIGLDKTGDVVYLIDSRGRDKAALVARTLATGEMRVLGEDSLSDIQGVTQHPTERTIDAYLTDYTKPEWHVLDPAFESDWAHLEKTIEGCLTLVSRTTKDDRWALAAMVDDGPVSYYLFDRSTKETRFLFVNRAEIQGYPLVKMHPVVIAARDGLKLVSYLSLPTGSDPTGSGRSAEPVPLVLWVHGGPWHRDRWGLNMDHQWFTNRGYAVLSVNYRGSTGYGKSFLNAANREWAGRMHDDLIDACNWAVKEGITTSDRIAIGGGSYGGWATLVGVTFTPDFFACGVDIVGPSSLVTLLQNVPPYWIPMLPAMTERIGDPNTEEGRAFLLSRSPLTRVDEIRRPLLIGQGANDPRVKQVEADQIVEAMQSRNIPVTYALYPDEGHGFARPENRISFYAIAEAFLSQHLGGRFEPVGKDFEGSTVEIRTGRDQIPGLPEA
jgi:dipeptidyl aminopeptidase/acylaminoacyl peptidase